MRKFILLLVLLSLPSAASAVETILDQPHWSLELKEGSFAPALDDWAHSYGKRSMPEYAASLAYKFLQQLELGVGVGSIRAKGQAFAGLHDISAGSVTYELHPVSVFAVFRGVVGEDQLLIPYVGGGWTRMNYIETIQDQGTVRGHANGYHIRGGLQLSLNILDQRAGNRIYQDYGIFRTSVFIEAERCSAVVRSVSIDLGGTAYAGGLLFEF